MESKGDFSTNSLILFSLVFLFLAFLIIKPFSLTGLIILPLVGDTSQIATSTLIGALVLFIVILIILIVVIKKLKKKPGLEKIPGLPEVPGPVSNIKMPSHEIASKKEALSEEELKQLFNDVVPKLDAKQILIEKAKTFDRKEFDELEKQISEKKEAVPSLNQPSTPKTVSNKKDFNDLRKLVFALLKKNYTKESVIKYLRKKGWGLIEISQVIQEINILNLKKYVKEAMALGYKKQKIIKELQSKGWTNEEINKALE